MALCRDCLRLVDPAGARRCPACGRPRLTAHDELERLTLGHIDCDAFYAAVEKRDNPALVDRPLIIGGGRRGVVSTACYIARTFGVRSAMPMYQALKLCPDAVVLPPDMTKYQAVGAEIRQRMLTLTPLVEPLSIDEAFLDLAGTATLHGACAAVVLARFARDIEHDLGLTVSVGLSYCKFLAKIASDLDKPRGFSVVGRADARGFLAPRPVTALPGVGAAMAARLAAAGLRLVGDLARADPGSLARFGKEGTRLKALALGDDPRPVLPGGDTVSVSSETTFAQDLADPEALQAALWPLAETLSRRLKAKGVGAATVVLKLKTADFRQRTRQAPLDRPTCLADILYRAAIDLLRREADGTAFRLIGIGGHDLVPAREADLPDLFDSRARLRRTDAAIDRVRARFGRDAIGKGRGLRPPPPKRR